MRSTPTGTRHSRGWTVANSTEYIQDGYADGSELPELLNTITREFRKQRVARLTQAIQSHLRPQAQSTQTGTVACRPRTTPAATVTGWLALFAAARRDSGSYRTTFATLPAMQLETN